MFRLRIEELWCLELHWTISPLHLSDRTNSKRSPSPSRGMLQVPRPSGFMKASEWERPVPGCGQWVIRKHGKVMQRFKARLLISIDALGSLWYRLDLAVKWRYERNHRFVISFSSEMINSDGQSFWEIVITCSAFSSMGEVEGDYASFWKCRERKDLHAYILVTYFGQFPCMDFCQKWHVVFMSWCCDFEDLADTESLVRMWWFCSTEVHSYTSKSIAACQANFGGGAS